ncbi:MAG: energy transducer TonB, partial [Chitinophagaceae bacterium]|nr:energy transducer TonB [Chitinophagaceae bacterium]
GGPAGWARYLEGKLYWPEGFEFANGNMAETIIEFELDETGAVTHAEVAVPFHSAFDKIALQVVKQSKGWKPARYFNRRIAYRMRQSITFRMDDE